MIKNKIVHRFTDKVLVIAFICAIGLPLIGSFLRWDLTTDLGEKRLLAELPAIGQDSIKTLPEKYETFYKDHFGFRNGLIQGHNWIRYRLFKGSSLGKVLFGKEDWLYLTKAGIIPDFLGQNPFTEQELDLWESVLEQRQKWLQERGIRYLFIIAPNKATIYPEFLPDHIQKSRGRSRMDQLIERFKNHPTIKLIDLRPPLLQAKPTGLLYHMKDSHWTDRGAFIAYQEICKTLTEWFPELRPLQAEDFLLTQSNAADDLSMMLGLGKELEDTCEDWIRKTPPAVTCKQFIMPDGYDWTQSIVPEDQLVMENTNAKHRLILFHDSFAVRGGLRELLGETFARGVFTSIDFSERLEPLLKQEQPDIIIHEIVERKLRDLPTLLPFLP
ncbi:MAG: hypothetical protein JXM79_07420 [Sedimentisphaerales bacterium]|nr:hypothetical protein [Sedimentisphaerales bacterium]